MSQPATQTKLIDLCVGELPLRARLEPWMNELAESTDLVSLVKKYGSPLNLLNPEPFKRNVEQIRGVAIGHNLDFEVYFARKSNKCLTFVEAANQIDAGVDVASLQELQQVLDAGTKTDRIICTAAIKTTELIEACVRQQITIAVDNLDELRQIASVGQNYDTEVNIAVRISGFKHQGGKLHSRFGFDVSEVVGMVSEKWSHFSRPNSPVIRGIHFHLDGYCPLQRVSAIEQSLLIVDQLTDLGHTIEFLDIGGGLPISYLESESQWNDFWSQQERALLGKRAPVTYRNHGLGLFEVDGKLHGKRKSYPFFQSLTRADWLNEILLTETKIGTIADSVRSRNVQLRCEPGRSVLDGAGMTVARVEFRKQHVNGDWLIGLAMNRTQCRTSSADFLVDPLLIRGATDGHGADASESSNGNIMEGFLVGAYCTESELLCLRRLRFPQGIEVGDLICFPNTAGYLMHFLESQSHQFPLAKNLAWAERVWRLDKIDN